MAPERLFENKWGNSPAGSGLSGRNGYFRTDLSVTPSSAGLGDRDAGSLQRSDLVFAVPLPPAMIAPA